MFIHGAILSIYTICTIATFIFGIYGFSRMIGFKNQDYNDNFDDDNDNT